MRVTGGGRRLPYHGWAAVCAALLLAGCASMPSSGEVRKVGDGQRADSGSQVRVFGIPPHPGESASDIVSGFLEATTSDEAGFATAKRYLTRDTVADWDPYANITVYASNDPQAREDDGTSRKMGWATVSLSGRKAAVVDAGHTYRPDQAPFTTDFHLVKVNNEWRIDGLADGLVMSQSNFQRLYHSVDMYYFADAGSDGRRTGGTVERLVADPVYLRNGDNDPLVPTVSALLAGPTHWLAPVVSSAAPHGAGLYDKGDDHGVTIDDSQHLRVRLDRAADRLRGAACTRFAAQLFATVHEEASPKLASAEVQYADGSTACVLPQAQAQRYGPAGVVGAPARAYFITSDTHRLVSVTAEGTTAYPVTGPFGGTKADLGSAAVRLDETMAAGVRTNGRSLVVGPLDKDGPYGPVQVTSKAHDAKDGLSAPSWDGFGDLWVADRDPADSRLLVLPGGTGQPQRVSVPGLSGRIQSLRVASDGVRIALVVKEGGSTTLQLGRIMRGGTEDRPLFSVEGLRTLTPADENVTSGTWAGSSRLVVLGTVEGGVQQIQYVNTDGSAGPPLQGVSQAGSVAASEDQSRQLLASYNGNVYRLPGDANWKQLGPKGGNPVYPG